MLIVLGREGIVRSFIPILSKGGIVRCAIREIKAEYNKVVVPKAKYTSIFNDLELV